MHPPEPLRRSVRLAKLLRNTSSLSSSSDPENDGITRPLPKRPRVTDKTTGGLGKNGDAPVRVDCLPRTRELQLVGQDGSSVVVMGIDEAGRGPLAGPVVAAAAIAPDDMEGIMDSKRITKEDVREKLYMDLIQSPNIIWAVAIVDAARIDEINILQATLEGMRMAAQAVMDPPPLDSPDRALQASASRQGCYVVCSANVRPSQSCDQKYTCLIDGNRLPKEMPCEAETMVKGDSKEFVIAAASILAKVTRDRLMREYDVLYPHFRFEQHKGYPTAAHMALVRQHGASPIHRRTFAPLKHMSFDKDGRIVRDDGDDE